jgi:hypothetical protein
MTPIPPMPPHHPWGALFGGIETFTNSLVKGMANVWPGVVEEEVEGNGGGGNGGSVGPLSVAFYRFFRDGRNVFPLEQKI